MARVECSDPSIIAGLFATACDTESCPSPLAAFRFPRRGEWFVYALVKGGRVVYVGQTSNIAARVVGHMASKDPFDDVLLAPVGAADATRLEKEVIAQLQPEWNIVGTPRMGPRVRRLDGSAAPASRNRSNRAIGLSARAPCIVQNGRYWKLVWKEGERIRSKGLGCIDKVSRRRAEARARELISAARLSNGMSNPTTAGT